MTKKINVLVFPAEGQNAYELHDALSTCVNIHLIGGTSVARHGEILFKNCIKNIPFISDKYFLQEFNEILRVNEIDVIFPPHDTIVKYLIENKEKITKMGDSIKDMEKVEKKEEPVIIRRQVVVDENKKVVKNLEEVGKISKNTQKEYNIVSRKPKKENKPMTLNELLGLGKKKEKQDIKNKEGKEIDMNKEDMQNKSNNKNYKEE